jgi:hypothetical protein
MESNSTIRSLPRPMHPVKQEIWGECIHCPEKKHVEKCNDGGKRVHKTSTDSLSRERPPIVRAYG